MKCNKCGSFVELVIENGYERYTCKRCSTEEIVSLQPTWEDLGISPYGPEFDD